LPPTWIFHLKVPKRQLPDGVFQDSSYLIYERENDHSFKEFNIGIEHLTVDLPNDVNVIIDKARDELEFLYKPIEKVRNKGYDLDRNKMRQELALECFDKNKNIFKFIKREYLEDRDAFDFNMKHRRGIIGRLLQKIIQDEGLGSLSYQRLYKKYTSTKPA
jgi:hypothetical protein